MILDPYNTSTQLPMWQDECEFWMKEKKDFLLKDVTIQPHIEQLNFWRMREGRDYEIQSCEIGVYSFTYKPVK